MFADGLVYALFALQQPLELDELRAGAATRSLPMADASAPDWFAAAAASGASLLEMAPELRDLVDESMPTTPDLVHLYRPELEEQPEVTEPAAERAPTVKIDLLKELAELDE